MSVFRFMLFSAKGGQYMKKGSFTTTAADAGNYIAHQKKPGMLSFI